MPHFWKPTHQLKITIKCNFSLCKWGHCIIHWTPAHSPAACIHIPPPRQVRQPQITAHMRCITGANITISESKYTQCISSTAGDPTDTLLGKDFSSHTRAQSHPPASDSSRAVAMALLFTIHTSIQAQMYTLRGGEVDIPLSYYPFHAGFEQSGHHFSWPVCSWPIRGHGD